MDTATALCLRKSQLLDKVSGVESDASIGARIRTLRERLGIQSQELAAKLGIDPSAMSNIENGKRAVKTEELADIASELRVSPLALLSDDSLLARLPVAPRAQPEATPDDAALGRLTALAELHEVLVEHDIPAEPRISEAPKVDTVRWLDDAKVLALWARDRLHLDGDSPDKFSALAEAIEHELGVDVLVETIEGNLFGASIVDSAFPFIWVNQDQPRTRGLFTLAHELGHVVSGRGSPITLDLTLSAKSNTERVANAFAAALLMPEDRVQSHIDADGRSAKALAEMILEFGVSFESLVYRLHNLGHINAEGRDQLRARGWTAVLSNLPNDSRKTLLVSMGKTPEQRPPGLLTMRAFRGYLAGAVSVRPLASLLDRNPDELLDQLVREQDSLEVLNASYPGDSTLEKEELYSGDPV